MSQRDVRGKTLHGLARAGVRSALRVSVLIMALVVTASAKGNATEPGFSWRACVSPFWKNTTFPFTETLRPRGECFPDTIYSWRTKSAVERLANASRTGPGLWPAITKGSGLFFWRTPLGSYGYGEVPVRVKLRPGTRFIPYVPIFEPGTKDYEQRRCETLRAKFGSETVDHAVFVARIDRMFSVTPSELLASYYEFILCADGPVESWSTGTAEGLAEIRREKRWIETHALEDYDALIRDPQNNTYWVNPVVNDVLETDDGRKVKTWIFDGHDWSTESLTAKLAGLETLLPGAVFFAPDVSPSRARHFQSALPSYFNPEATLPPRK